MLALDGVFSEAEAKQGSSGEVRFHEATLLTPEHWRQLERAVQRRVLRAFQRCGLLEEDVAADMLTWHASGGFSVDASVRVEGEDRAGVERLVRYCARGPLALERLHALGGLAALASPDARLLYRLPEPDRQGRTELVLSPLELLERLARLIPPPRIHRHRYHGLLAPHARLRAEVVAIGRDGARARASAAEPDEDPASAAEAESSAQLPVPAAAGADPKRPSPARIAWAQLLARIYEVLPLLCPVCGGELRIVAFLTDPPFVHAILLHLGLRIARRSSWLPEGHPRPNWPSTRARASTPPTPTPPRTSTSISRRPLPGPITEPSPGSAPPGFTRPRRPPPNSTSSWPTRSCLADCPSPNSPRPRRSRAHPPSTVPAAPSKRPPKTASYLAFRCGRAFGWPIPPPRRSGGRGRARRTRTCGYAEAARAPSQEGSKSHSKPFSSCRISGPPELRSLEARLSSLRSPTFQSDPSRTAYVVEPGRLAVAQGFALMPPLELRMLGGAAIHRDGQPLSGRASQKRRVALLALLALAPSRTLTRDRLLAYLWPDSDTQRGRHLLAVAVYEIRKILGEEVIVTRGDDLELAATVGCDVATFEAACEARDFRDAVAIYAGPLLDGFHIGDAPDFEEWVSAERQRLATLHKRALEQLARSQTASGDTLAAVATLRTLAHIDPYHSRVARELMLALDAAGDRAAALQHARIHTVLLREEFGAEPDPEVSALAESLRSAPTAAARDPVPQRAAPLSPVAGLHPPPETPAPAETSSVAAHGTTGAVGTPSRGRARTTSHRRRRRWVPIITMAVALTALLFAALPSARRVLRRENPGAPARPAPAPSVAVLPFDNLSSAPENALLGAGLSEEISTALGRLEGLRVIARTSAIAFHGGDHDVREVGRLLNATHVIEGTINTGSNRIKVSARLIDAATGHMVWSDEYDRPLLMADQLAMEEEIARAVVGALQLRLGTSTQPLVARTTDNLEAYNLYLEGRDRFDRRTVQSMGEALGYFQRATELDSAYALAWAAQAEVYTLLGAYEYSVLPPASAFELAREAANRALQLDPGRAEAYAALGNVYFNYDRDAVAAERAFGQALEVNRGYAPAYHWYSLFLATRGRMDDAEAAILRAGELDPLSRVMWTALARHRYFRRDFDGAARAYADAVRRDSTFVTARLGLALSLAAKGDLTGAIAQLDVAAAMVGPDASIVQGLLGYLHGRSGNRERARQHLAALSALEDRGYVSGEHFALVHLGLGDNQGAIEALERALRERSGGIAYLDIEPVLDPLRGERRFQDLRTRAGF